MCILNIKSLVANSWLLMILITLAVQAQTTSNGYQLSGRIIGADDSTSLIGVNLQMISQIDTTKKIAATTNAAGEFLFVLPINGTYRLKASYIGYKPLDLIVRLQEPHQTTGTLMMLPDITQLKNVVVHGKQIAVRQKGDTTEYAAGAFKTNPDATAEDLVTKMPGVSLENGTVKAQGEEVNKVLVDGQEFFGDDATLALRNLPAEIIDKIQVFDRLSDQAQFTGFDDGQTQKTMNIVTKPGKNNGQFGKVYAGYGTDDRYSAGGNINFFQGKRRISIIGLSNNINQQNFSMQDLLGVSSGGNTPGGGRPGGGQRGMGGGGQGGGMAPGSNTNNFMVGQQGGINNTQSIGLNYSDVWGKKVKVTGSYFFNNANNLNSSTTRQENYLAEDQSQYYNEESQTTSKNFNHRFNLRLEYTIDPSNSIIVTPRLSLQKNYSTNLSLAVTSLENTLPISETVNEYKGNSQGYNFNNSILFRHRFKKAGRTFSVSVNTALTDKISVADQYAQNEYFTTDSTAIINQQINSTSNQYVLSSRLSYTEPLSRKSILEFNYQPSYSKSNTNKETFAYDDFMGEYQALDSSLSNQFNNEVITQSTGMSYRLRGSKFNFSTGVNYQHVQLLSNQTFPQELEVFKPFNNLMPMAMLNYRFSRSKNARIFYRSSTTTPSITQLQNVIDNTNTLLLTSGNPDLKQQYTHNLVFRYGSTNIEKASNLFLLFNGNYTSDYIATSTFIANKDTLLTEGIVLAQGSQLSKPVNVGGSWNIRSLLTYGMPFKLLKSNVNLHTEMSYRQTPGLINEMATLASTYNIGSGLTVSSNISEKVDFRLAYSANYNLVNNSIQEAQTSSYFYQVSSGRLNWMPWKGLVVNTDVSHSLYRGLGDGFNQNFLLWNAAIGYKFLKNNAAELRLTVFDILHQNNSLARTVTETYILDKQTQVLQQYAMLTFTYTLRNFQPASQTQRPIRPFPGTDPFIKE